MIKKWKLVSRVNPPVGVTFWGFDVFYNEVQICKWNGDSINDDGDPFPSIIKENGSDYSVEYWMEQELTPDPPNVDVTSFTEVEEVQINEEDSDD